MSSAPHPRVHAAYRHLPLRDVEGIDRFELFLTLAVGTIAVVRIGLQLSGYPQIGGGGLHFAHLLWGGLLMLIALLIMLLFLSRTSRTVSACFAGIGFGLFIDEVGKFVTGDNNYFFSPVAAIIYTVFVVMYLAVTFGVQRRPLSRREHLVNAVEMVKECAARDLDSYEREKALALLDGADPSDPLVQNLRRAIDDSALEPTHRPFLGRIYDGARRLADRLQQLRWLGRWVVVLVIVFLVASAIGPVRQEVGHTGTRSLIYLVAAAVSLILGVIGAVAWFREDRLRALTFFRISLLLELLVVQFFRLLANQFGGAYIVLINLVLLGICRAAELEERRRAGNPAQRDDEQHEAGQAIGKGQSAPTG